jgi:hypothetical protein
LSRPRKVSPTRSPRAGALFLRKSVSPRSLDQHPSCSMIAGLRNGAATHRVTGRAFRRNEAENSHQLLRVAQIGQLSIKPVYVCPWSALYALRLGSAHSEQPSSILHTQGGPPDSPVQLWLTKFQWGPPHVARATGGWARGTDITSSLVSAAAPPESRSSPHISGKHTAPSLRAT